MRIALISDLHGNQLALDRVLAAIGQAGVDELVCLGDVATLGPRPREVLDRLRALGCRCIMGNHDEFLLDPELIKRYSEVPEVVRAVDWCRDQLTEVDLAYLRGFERQRELSLGGEARLLLFHGSPRSHMEDLLATTPPDQLDTMLDGRRATVLAGGHTHIQMLRQHAGMLLVNPGSLGMPFRDYVAGQPPRVLDHAEYAIVEATTAGVRIELCRVQLERRALKAQAESCAHPLREYLAQQYA